MLLKNIDLNFYPSLPLNYKFSADGQLCIPAGQITYILSNSVLNPDLVSNPPVPSKFRPGDENKIDYRASENRPDVKGDAADSDDDDEDDASENGTYGNGANGGRSTIEAEADVEDDTARPEFQFHWQKLELLDDDRQDDVMKGGVTFQLDQTFKEGFARQMEWSPLGAGKHRRCVMSAICIRTSVVGRGLKLHMKLLDRLLDQDVPADEAVEIKWDSLPREICWSQPCTFHTQRWGIPVLTMVDDTNELRFVKVIDDEVETLLTTRLELPEGARIVNMCWSPWFVVSPVEGVSFFTFRSGGGVYLQKMILTIHDGEPRLECSGSLVIISTGMSPGYEPHVALWHDRVYNLPDQPPETLLAVVQHDGLELFGVTLDREKDLRVCRQAKVELELPARLSGYTFSDPLWANYLDLNICSTNGGLAIFKIDLADISQSIVYKAAVPTFKGRQMIHNDPSVPHPNPWKRDWIDILDEKREAFIQEWRIVQASCHVYGMTYSPVGGILAICYRLKPEGVLEYPIKERERCTLSWELCRSWMDMFDSSRAMGSAKPFTLFGICGEAFAGDIRFLVDPEEAEESFGKMEEVIAQGMTEPEIPQKGEEQVYLLAGVPAPELAGRLGLALFNSSDSVLLRARNLLGLLRTNKLAPKKPGVLTAQTGITKLLLQNVLEVPVVATSPLFAGRQSILTIRLLARLGIVAFYRTQRVMQLAVAVVDALEREFMADVSAERAAISQRERVLQDPGNLDLLMKMDRGIGGPALESCSTCGSPVPFDDLMSGRCGNGHLFRRCAATFVVVVGGDARVCGLCGREYVSKGMVEADEAAAGGRTLFGVLFEAVDTCVFCGGGFYDRTSWRHADS
ncbi:hypothetical protein DRE_04683 [Drechslerella stenobrocha 248]|uniref:Uncharacterized protein n=1 Tax=Drechslerella stenobrocha 248 TaxID=1043628 RepID=W7HSC2_9PEZI|nr:hypothetical protein DRE_04683 [Drechslerella stenobrocha 248]